MKNLLLTIFSLLLFAIPELSAQTQIDDGTENPLISQERGRNIISCNAYDAIKYNGHTLADLNNTEGNASDLNQLIGSPSSVNNDNAILNEVAYYYGDNKIAFMEGEVIRMEIKKSNWPLTITGKTITVGDTFSQMKQKFGNDLKIIYKPTIDDNYTVSFNCNGNERDGLLINFNTATNKVVEIIYFVNP
ncbi:hypothetical protein [Gracilimonas sp.]|uniref:hypothetical protein n=1 Tax=Gracilimonas sp. TaxID=1974203 RepID=UPI0032ECCD8F